jgi:serine protease Do
MNGYNERKGKKMNAWKRYGVIFMASVILTGSAAGTGVLFSNDTVQASEQDQEVTLNIADQEEEAETEAAEASDGADASTQLSIAEDAEDADETESEAKKTFAQVQSAEADTDQIITTDVSNIVENVMPSIVSINIKAVTEVDTYYGVQEYEYTGAGSGIIIAQNDEELLIATNSHVVADSTDLAVTFTADAEDEDDLQVSAKIKGMDTDYELAVIAVRLEDIDEDVLSQLKIATLGSSDSLKVGQAAVAIGNALGYGQSVTCGIISALDREVTIDDFSKKLIMTDASINFGNSGGALLNSKGQVIGINVAKETADAVEGMGYSIPIDAAIPILQNLINKETRDQLSDDERGYIGATVVNVSDDAKELYNMPEGAFVYDVTEGSAAEQAGIKKGDVITKFDGDAISSSSDLIDKISYYAVGETVTIEVQTANSGEYVSHEVEVTLQEGTSSTTDDDSDSEENGDDGNFDLFQFGNDDDGVF